MSRKFIIKNEGFICLNCGKEVFKDTNGSYRNHCNFCLYSLHVDKFPGDRKEYCHGLQEPIFIDIHTNRTVIYHKCTKCGKEKKNKALNDDNVVNVVLSDYNNYP